MKSMKWLLNLKPSTNWSYASYVEVVRFHLYKCRYQSIIKYFLNLFTKKVNNCIFNTVTVNQIQRVNNNMDLSSCFFKVRICYNCQGLLVCGYPQSLLMLIVYTSVKKKTTGHVHLWVEIWLLKYVRHWYSTEK